MAGVTGSAEPDETDDSGINPTRSIEFADFEEIPSSAENALWARGKAPIHDDAALKRKAILNNTAARNLSGAPGQLTWALLDLEIQTRLALTDLNYEVLSKTLERELTRLGIHYDRKFKDEQLSWEIENTILYQALADELTELKKAQADEDLNLSAFAIEIGLRQAFLINAKALIEGEVEVVKEEIAAMQRSYLTGDIEGYNELALAKKRLLTMEKRLEIIPFLDTILLKEQDIFTENKKNYELSKDLLANKLLLTPISKEIAEIKEYLLLYMDAFKDRNLTIENKKAVLAKAKDDYEIAAYGKIEKLNDIAASRELFNTSVDELATAREKLKFYSIQEASKISSLLLPTQDYVTKIADTLPYLKELEITRKNLINPLKNKTSALETLIVPLLNKATETKTYATSVERQSILEKEIKDVAYKLEALKGTGVEAEIAVMQAKVDAGEFEEALIAAGVVLKTLYTQNKADLILIEATDTATYLTEKELAQDAIILKEKEAIDKQVTSKVAVAGVKMKGQLAGVETTIEAQSGYAGSIEKTSRIRASERKKTASIAAAADITSTLIHQIG